MLYQALRELLLNRRGGQHYLQAVGIVLLATDGDDALVLADFFAMTQYQSATLRCEVEMEECVEVLQKGKIVFVLAPVDALLVAADPQRFGDLAGRAPFCTNS